MEERSTVRDPRSEMPCVWELAGVLAQHPCDRDYACESCELHNALCGGDGLPSGVGGESWRHPRLSAAERERETDAARLVAGVLGGCRLFLDRWYSPTNVWLMRDPARAGVLSLGLMGCVWKILAPVDEFIAPHPGIDVGRNEPCGWLVRDTLTVPLRLPVPGTVIEVNDVLVEEVNREGIAEDPDAWLLRLDTDADPEDDSGLLRGEKALAWQLRKMRILKGFVREAIDEGARSAGRLRADGGTIETDLSRVLGADRFSRLLEALV